MNKHVFHSNSPPATTALGKKIGSFLQVGSILALSGELGCGKTLFVRSVCAGLGVPLRQVNSPTFVLVNEYHGRLPVFHLDMYQLGSEADAVELGITDYLTRAESGIMIIEWAEKILPLLPDDLMKVGFEILSAKERRIELVASSERFGSLMEALRRQ